MNILICEDNPLVALDLRWSLEDLGHTVVATVATSVACLLRATELKPDLVIMDLNLADGRTGLGLVEALAKLGILSVIVSGEAHLVPPTTSAKAVLGKPFNDILLARAVESVSPQIEAPGADPMGSDVERPKPD